jgi:hypothetical protein
MISKAHVFEEKKCKQKSEKNKIKRFLKIKKKEERGRWKRKGKNELKNTRTLQSGIFTSRRVDMP